MKHRNGIASFTVLALSIGFSSLSSDSSAEVSAQQKVTQLKIQKDLRKSPRIKGVIKGSEKPDEIPDMVAYELFLRTVAEGNARALVKIADLTDGQVDTVFREANDFAKVFEPNDKHLRDLRQNKADLSEVEVQSRMAVTKARVDGILNRMITEWLPRGLGREGMARLRNFMGSEVKGNIQKLLLYDSPQAKTFGSKKKFASSFAAQAVSGGGELYLYSAAWNDESGIYGSGTLTEQFSSTTSYSVSVTVASPSGRSNSASGDWSYAATTNSAGLSMGVEDGTYSITADFYEQEGYYDEYGNFYGTGSNYVGSESTSTLVAPQVYISGVDPASSIIGIGQSRDLVARVGSTNDVPDNAVVTVEMFEHNFTNPRPQYSVTGGRTKQVVIDTPGTVKTVTFPVTVGGTSPTDTGGSVTNRVRVQSVTPATVTIGTTADVTFTVPTPVPTPTPGGGGECRSGYTDSGKRFEKYKESDTSNRCSSCNPDTAELFFFVQSGGTYDWVSCFCGQSPIVLDILGNGYDLTNAINGIFFDITATGRSQRIAWTSPNSDDAWLVLDRNQNNRIDDGRELFGNISEQPDGQDPRQGFASLGMFDTSELGGNGDGQITRRDAVFRRLRLWVDRNHNGISEPEELVRLSALDVVAISLDYRESNRVDQHGNRFKYRAKVRDRANANLGRWAWDVFLRTQP